MIKMTVQDINEYVGTTVNPLNSPDTMYELYSVPSFDSDYPEVLHGSEIGSSKVTVEENDVLVCKINPRINRVWVVKHHTNHQLIASSEWVIIRSPKNDARYLKYYFQSPTFRTYINSGLTGIGGSLTRAQPKQIAKYPVPISNIEIQHSIADTLDKLQSLITHRKQQLEKLDELVKARFVEMFMGKDYPILTLDSLSVSKGEYGAQSSAIEYDSTRPRYVRITDINDDGTLNDDTVSSSNIDDDIQYKLSYGDFLFARMGATVGKSYAYKSGNQIYAGYLIRYKLNLEKILPDYLYSYTRLNEYWEWVKLNQSGAAQPGINAKKYGSLQIPVAPIHEQNQFAAFVTQVDKSKVAVQKALDEAQLLFDSLMQEYFG